jgi:hypothetical protein
MWNRRLVVAGLLALAWSATSSASALPRPATPQPGSVLQPGAALPPLQGQTLTGRQLDLNTASGSRAAILIFSFSRAGGRDAQNWSRRLAKDRPLVPIYTVIFLQSVPHLFRSMALAGIRSGMSPSMRSRTLILYQDENLWKQRLGVGNESNASLILLNPDSHIAWISSGPWSEALYQSLIKGLDRTH